MNAATQSTGKKESVNKLLILQIFTFSVYYRSLFSLGVIGKNIALFAYNVNYLILGYLTTFFNLICYVGNMEWMMVIHSTFEKITCLNSIENYAHISRIKSQEHSVAGLRV